MIQNNLAGLILAGGQSRRMGEDKALLTVNGAPLLDHCETFLKALGCHQIIVCSDNLSQGIPDNYPNIGPVAGIEAGLTHLINNDFNGQVIIVPIDMILLKPESIMLLLESLSNHDIVRFLNYPLPVVMSLNQTIHTKMQFVLETACQAGGISIKAMCDAFKSITIEPTKEQLPEFFNCNTQEDLRQLQILVEQ